MKCFYGITKIALLEWQKNIYEAYGITYSIAEQILHEDGKYDFVLVQD